jgi:hypothetical protein
MEPTQLLNALESGFLRHENKQKCQNVGDSEVGDPKLATRKYTKIGEIVDYRRWESAVGTPPLSYSSVAHFLPFD